jgi:SAM-dependent methyltransferase
MDNPLAPLAGIMARHGVQCTPEEFHSAVNVSFHRFESEVYDQLHQDMWLSLPQQSALLADDCLRAGAPERIRMLDIGSGTGLATDVFLRSALGPRIAEVDLLDTSAVMLARADSRRKQWAVPGDTIEGTVESLVGRKSYHLIITCSVLHHVPDLASFLGAVSRLQDGIPGALFVHLQDPNGDFVDDPQRRARAREISRGKLPDSIARFTPSRILARLMREINGSQGQDYLSKTNQELLRNGVITKPLNAGDIFAITDIHVRDGGISIDRLKAWLRDYTLVARRTYAFFGALRSTLPARLQDVEDQCIRDGALNGEYVAAAWRRP